ncbi:uncharacterized protein BT62DRAFT_929618 [Guyanagaster necrorhizus]|uniref:Uncharacterized protein n=1 Tax=Guyanagaster necrorhizus TaxID=856835 RepID=A0A9P8AUR9_9AGAR|nr:uncharacterized protein BT62DRAFT_929618 [Guyanagaster necrorhizus MCA 3950]KAG7448535.1 hypothetical protein BT62DRAFT_929618 [Guyanagaster necrorhizus MCA 3950]
MMLVQKQPNFNISSPHFVLNHRKHPSAPPAVIVQATRTPGLLSIQRAQQRVNPSPKPRHALARVFQPARPDTQQQLLKPSPEIVEKKPSPQLSPEKRGRQLAKVKAKTARSSSRSPVRGRRNHTRQPSPKNLIQNPSQDEVPSTPTRKSTAANIFDSFSADFDSLDDFVSPPVRVAPTLASHPSGKLARRRQPQASGELSTPGRAIPVPQHLKPIPLTLSRSLPARPFKGKTAPDTSNWKPFPICDDSIEAGTIFDNYSPPTTPTRQRPSRSKRFDDGPRTAPLTRSVTAFSFNLSPSPSAPKKASRHVRVSSDGVFHMSDEDLSSQSISEDASSSDEMSSGPRQKALCAPRPGMTQQEIEGYFASSTFQNSPSPEELPPPAFL